MNNADRTLKKEFEEIAEKSLTNEEFVECKDYINVWSKLIADTYLNNKELREKILNQLKSNLNN